MDYPRDFPEHLKPAVDAALHEAEGEFFDAKKKSKYFSSEADGLLFKYILKVFTAFAYGAALAEEQGFWSGERTRLGIHQGLRDIARYAYYEHHPHPGSDYSFGCFCEEAESWIKDSDEWRKIQGRLKEVAELQSRAGSSQSPQSSPPKMISESTISAQLNEAALSQRESEGTRGAQGQAEGGTASSGPGTGVAGNGSDVTAVEGLAQQSFSSDIAARAARRQAVVNPILQGKGWKRGRLVTEAGVSKNSVYKYLDGTRSKITAPNRKAIAEVLGLSEEQLPD